MGRAEGRHRDAQVIGRHAHSKAPPDEDLQPVTYTGIDYLGLVTSAVQAKADEQPRLSNMTRPAATPAARQWQQRQLQCAGGRMSAPACAPGGSRCC